MQPLNSLPKYNMFGIEDTDYKKAKVVVLPIPYDSTVTYKSGTRDGPRAIINASRNMELYSYELGRDISKSGIYTMDEMAPDLSSAQNMVKGISREVGIILDNGKVPLILGGEHTITIGAVDAISKKNKDFSVVQLDAHADSRDEMFGTKYMHATAMKRCSELAKNVVGIGIRSTHEPRKDGKKLKYFFMDEVRKRGIESVAKEVAKITEKKIYLTIDADVFDPSEMPSVGTPEPDGLRFNDALVLIKELAKSKKLLGFDIVELSPMPGFHAPDYQLAKLAYLTIGYFLDNKTAD